MLIVVFQPEKGTLDFALGASLAKDDVQKHFFQSLRHNVNENFEDALGEINVALELYRGLDVLPSPSPTRLDLLSILMVKISDTVLSFIGHKERALTDD